MIQKLNKLFKDGKAIDNLTDYQLRKLLTSIITNIEILQNYKSIIENEQDFRLQPYINTKIGFKPKKQ